MDKAEQISEVIHRAANAAYRKYSVENFLLGEILVELREMNKFLREGVITVARNE